MTPQLLTFLAAFTALAVMAVMFTRPIFEDGKWLFLAIAALLTLLAIGEIGWSFFLYRLRSA